MPTLDLDTLVLAAGKHDSPEDGMCFVEAESVAAGEPFSDHLESASPVIEAFLRSWNDALNNEDRQQLKRHIGRLAGTAASAEVEDARAWMALDWLVRTYTPTWLRLAKLTDQAVTLETLPEFTAGMDVPSIRPTIDAIRKDAAAAGAAAWDAGAAWAAGDAAAGAAAWDAGAAWAAGDAAARDAAWAARAAAWAARDAARDVLRPTVVELQAAAHQLIERMLAA